MCAQNNKARSETMGSPIKWLGSKRKMAKTIIQMIPIHKIYVEPFFGGGSVFFTKYVSQYEIVNDVNDLLVNFFRVIQKQLGAFVQKFEFALHSRKVFETYAETNWAELTDPVEKAFRFYYLIKNAYCGLYRVNQRGEFNAPFGHGANAVTEDGMRNRAAQFFDLSVIKKAYKRLQRATIECLDYADVVSKYDSPHTFFFFDPPYDTDYTYGLGKFDYPKLKKILQDMQGSWILTVNAELASQFSEYQIVEFDHARRRIGGADRKNLISDIIVKCSKKPTQRRLGEWLGE